MQKLNTCKPLKAGAIYIKGQRKPLTDRIIFVAGSFIIVANDTEDAAPTWYNTDIIERLEGVQAMPDQPRRAYFF